MVEHIDATRKHVQQVQKLMLAVAYDLMRRALVHDESKFGEFEARQFANALPRLKGLTYGSPEYHESLKLLGPALKHHQENNMHHPEYWEAGVNDMNLLDVVEMFCDWKAASMRHTDGNIHRSIDVNKERFKISEQLASIFENTVPFINSAAAER